jgi:multiple sugar transport system permease protein
LLLYRAALQSVPEEHYEAALIEGANLFAKFRYITLPVISPIIQFNFIMSIIGNFNELGGPLLMTGGGPAGFTETVMLYAYKNGIKSMDYSYGITLANIVFVFTFIATGLQMKFSSGKKED